MASKNPMLPFDLPDPFGWFDDNPDAAGGMSTGALAANLTNPFASAATITDSLANAWINQPLNQQATQATSQIWADENAAGYQATIPFTDINVDLRGPATALAYGNAFMGQMPGTPQQFYNITGPRTRLVYEHTRRRLCGTDASHALGTRKRTKTEYRTQSTALYRPLQRRHRRPAHPAHARRGRRQPRLRRHHPRHDRLRRSHADDRTHLARRRHRRPDRRPHRQHRFTWWRRSKAPTRSAPPTTTTTRSGNFWPSSEPPYDSDAIEICGVGRAWVCQSCQASRNWAQP